MPSLTVSKLRVSDFDAARQAFLGELAIFVNNADVPVVDAREAVKETMRAMWQMAVLAGVVVVRK